ncbi:capsid assembly scaffolding protein Gp46 family protein [Eremococcus coleocola]|uniref:Phage minor structural protein GP20 n=1 Tax=Eremococcus coleocola ACS-139-V-Col8 TaxID=908337 RepID=E4KQI2_9LACT|nr:DUF4355 domain-containing protein [Eremococcus coleocola]EFR30593.1 hypothetical protein HMPREF9257_0539 [Eremococcus coleocola ACS-139-V-Col8]
MSEFKTIETQEELDSIIKARLDRERDKHQKELADLKSRIDNFDEINSRVKELETENGALKENAEKATAAIKDFETKAADYEAKISGYETEKIRNSIAVKYGLPLDLANRIKGDTEEDMAADAEQLSSYLKPKNTAPMKSLEPQVGDDDGWKQMARSLTNRD